MKVYVLTILCIGFSAEMCNTNVWEWKFKNELTKYCNLEIHEVQDHRVKYCEILWNKAVCKFHIEGKHINSASGHDSPVKYKSF